MVRGRAASRAARGPADRPCRVAAMGGGVGRILKITSGFTLAHSITLALAALGIFQPPARIVEPLIALSIVYVGVDNLRARARGGGRDGRALVAFAFGLVHGFGFAS